MQFLWNLLDTLSPFGPLVTVVIIFLVALFVARRMIQKKMKLSSGLRFREQMVTVLISATGFLLAILFLPVSDGTRGQLLNLFGLAITAVVALSSTTVVANAMAGLMLRFMRSFEVGDMVGVMEQTGRVTEIGLFHTEIQTESRDLVTLPNTLLISNPVKVVRSSGTFLTVTVTLGYEVHHALVEEVMINAAKQAGLEKPVVHVKALLDNAVEHRLAGFTAETDKLFTLRSRLHRRVLDALHDAGIEIVSPSFMYQRPQTSGEQMIPKRKMRPEQSGVRRVVVEDVAFDKAKEAEGLEKLRKEQVGLAGEVKQLKEQMEKADIAEKARLGDEIEKKEKKIEKIAEIIQTAQKKEDEEGK